MRAVRVSMLVACLTIGACGGSALPGETRGAPPEGTEQLCALSLRLLDGIVGSRQGGGSVAEALSFTAEIANAGSKLVCDLMITAMFDNPNDDFTFMLTGRAGSGLITPSLNDLVNAPPPLDTSPLSDHVRWDYCHVNYGGLQSNALFDLCLMNDWM